jgi:hypothetical protein
MVLFSVSCRLQIRSTCVRFILWVWGIGILDTQKGMGKGAARLLPLAAVEPSPGNHILARQIGGTLVPSRRTAWKHLIFRDERNREPDSDSDLRSEARASGPQDLKISIARFGSIALLRVCDLI